MQDDFLETHRSGGNSFMTSRVHDSQNHAVTTRKERSEINKFEEKNETSEFLSRLKKAFDKADTSKKGFLTFEQWRNSEIKNFLNDGNISQEKFELFFMRIDSNSDELVTWDELCQYLLMNDSINGTIMTTTSTSIEARKTVQCGFDIGKKHREMCTYSTISLCTNELITVSPESIHFWNLGTLEHKRSLIEPGNFVAVLSFDVQSMFVIVTTTRRLLFYEAVSLSQFPIEINASPSKKAIKAMTKEDALYTLDLISIGMNPLFNIPISVLKAENNTTNDMYFFVGDDEGSIESFIITEPKRRQTSDFTVARLGKNVIHKKKILCMIHMYSNYYASVSEDCTLAIWTWDIETHDCKVVSRITDQSPMTKVIFIEEQKVFVTCNMTKDISVWSQSGRRIFLLGGHTNHPIFLSKFQTADEEEYIISMTNKKEFILWETTNFKRTTLWSDITLQRPKNEFGTAAYDANRKILYTISSVPSAWKDDQEISMLQPTNSTIMNFVVDVLYSPLFNQIICIDVIGNFSVWDMQTGSLMVLHTNRDAKTKDICTSCLDNSNRRLFIGSLSGEVSIWNYNNGLKISNADLQTDGQRISLLKTGNVIGQDFLFRGNSNYSISTFTEFTRGQFDMTRKFSVHDSDIVDLIPLNDGFITASDNGSLYFWQLDQHNPIVHETIPDQRCEAITAIAPYIIAADSKGSLYVYSLPRFALQEIIPNGHFIYVPYTITQLCSDKEKELVYSADSLGYVKKWELRKVPMPELVMVSFIRCANKGISVMKLICGGKYLLTCSTDSLVMMWETEDMSYIGCFKEGSRWNLADKSTWIMKSPYEIDQNHTTRVERAKRIAKNMSIKSSRSFKDLLGFPAVMAKETELQKDKKDHEEEEEERKPFDYEAVGRVFENYFSEVQEEDMSRYEYASIRNHITASKSAADKGRFELNLNSKPQDLIEQINFLYKPTQPVANTSKQAEVKSVAAKLVKPNLKKMPIPNLTGRKRPIYSSLK